MTRVCCKASIDVSADAAWKVISNFGSAGQYLSGAVNCAVESAGAGALRTLDLVDGSTVIERLESLDEAAHCLSYTLLTDMPFRNCLTTLGVRTRAYERNV